MIQLSALPTTSPENQAKTPLAAAHGAAFAGVLTEKMDGGLPATGNNLPASGKILPATGNGTQAASADLPAKATAEVRIVPASQALMPQILMKKVAADKAESAEATNETAPATHTAEFKATAKQGKLAEALKTLQRQLNAPGKADTEDRLGEDVPDAVAPTLEHLDVPLPLLLSAAITPPSVAAIPAGTAHGAATPQGEGSEGGPQASSNGGAPSLKLQHRAEMAATLLKPAIEDKAGGAAQLQQEAKQAAQAQAGSGDTPRTQLAREFQIEQSKDAKSAGLSDALAARTDRSVAAKQVAVTFDAMSVPVADSGSSAHRSTPAGGVATQQPTVRPQDFSTLVDRLVEARENARAGSANISVMHSDFGEVSLRFSHDNGNLTVSMTSRDPEFARAVNAAVPTDGSQTGEAPFQREGRHDGAATFSARTDSNANPSGGQNAAASSRGERHGWSAEADAETPSSAETPRSTLGGVYA